MNDTSWVCLHVHLSHRQDDYLRDVVRPLFQSMMDGELVDRCFFLRYWQEGPHIRVRLHPRISADRARIRHALLENSSDWLREGPAAPEIDERSWLDAVRPWAAAEGERDVLPPLPHGSLVESTYRPEHDRYGRGAVLEAVERHFTDSSRLALRHLEHDMPTRARLTLTATWLAESHAEGLVSDNPALAGSPLAHSVAELVHALRTADDAPPISRVVRDCAHLLANRLGIGPLQEDALRALVLATRADRAFA
ncbi:lantibiotic dehydratase C-terminal domain-containing protein [Lentzea sp. HUAS12]|uniref:lantibiotic dehydratase C-terminal domain-containing protein n=1 Tax=Lentzea sp. HUAS12 TaxID=2951806 RepID=UPI00209DBA61|nr:lantibiotic dehydratase C-terminal domain-containing protein [Lentzea sp. HUAS12]USX56355.1 hypothetical protein ND450_20310 [Lentzea sp. HUAS12]